MAHWQVLNFDQSVYLQKLHPPTFISQFDVTSVYDNIVNR